MREDRQKIMGTKTYRLWFAEWNGSRSKQVQISEATKNKSVRNDALVGMRDDRLKRWEQRRTVWGLRNRMAVDRSKFKSAKQQETKASALTH